MAATDRIAREQRPAQANDRDNPGWLVINSIIKA
jgi:hypothetical protein